MASKTTSLCFLFLSVLLHCVLIFALIKTVSFSHNPSNDIKPLKSYIYRPTKPELPQPDSIEKADTSTETLEEHNETTKQSLEPAPRLEEATSLLKQEQVTLERPGNLDSIKNTLPTEDELLDTADVEPQTPKAFAQEAPDIDLRQSTYNYIQNLNSAERDALSRESMEAYDNPLANKNRSAPSSKNAELRKQSESFAGKVSGVTVLSQRSPDETIVKTNNGCYVVRQTAVDDRVWNGKQLWTPTSACEKYDKFDGQLEISLDKFLKK